MFQVIKGVDIGQGAGNAFGGGIYGASCEIGFSNGPTKISLNVVSTDGNYQSIIPNVYSTPYHINLNGKVFSGMYLYGYEKTKSAGTSVLSVDFVDSSIILDKVYVGLLHRHGNQKKQTQIVTGLFTVRCPTCTDGIITGYQGSARRYLDVVPGGSYNKKGSDGGGYIILGKENFPDTNCEIPRVDYNFTELCQALTKYGISHQLSSFDLNSLYRQEYAGTLREVLNNWAADFSFEFFFDGTVLKAIDLRKPVDITSVQSFASSNQFVVSTTYGETLENTYTQSVVARFLKPSTAVEYNNTFHYKQVAVQIGISDILNGGACAGRAGDTLLTSIALARVDKALREAYIANVAVNTNDMRPLQALGFQYDTTHGIPYQLSPSSVAQLVQYVQATNSEFTKNGGSASDILTSTNYVAYIGLFRQDIKEQLESWDSEAANFLGKYYRFLTPLPINRFDCPYSRDWFIYYTYDSKWTTIPSSNTYGGDAVPFASLLRDPSSNTNLVNFRPQNIFSVEDNAWGIEPEIYNATKGTANYDYLKPVIIPITENLVSEAMALMSVTQGFLENSLPSGVYSNLLDRKATDVGAQIACILIPVMNKFTNAPKISNLCYRTINKAVYDRLSTRSSSDDKSVRCLTYCDINLVAEICACGAQYTPVPYFASLLAPYIVINHSNGNACNIVFPVDSNYYAYFTHTRYFKTTYPPVKTIYGEPPYSPTNTMATKVVDYDITSDLEAVMDNNDAVNQFIYSPTNQTIMTASQYYAALANLNNFVVPPQKSVKVTVARTDLGSLGLNLSPANGLTSINLSLSDGGVQSELTYATRPPTLPKADAIYPKIKYRLKGR